MKEYIVITPSNLKKKVIELSRKKYYNYNIKFMSINEFIDKYTFSYDNKTIYNIMNKYNINLSSTLVYLNNLCYISNKLNNSKMILLKDIKKYLEDNNLLIYDNRFKEYVKDKEIHIYGYNYINKYYLNIFKDLNYIVHNIEYNNYDIDKIYEFNYIDDEVIFVIDKIYELLRNNISIDKIKLIISNEYREVIYRLFKIYNIPINIKKRSIYSIKVVKDILNNLDDLDNSINNIKEDNIKEKVIKVLNNYSFINNKKEVLDLIINDLKNTYLDEDNNGIKVSTIDDIYNNDDYVFLLGFNKENIPVLYKDNEYFSDKEKLVLGLDTSNELNINKKIEVIRKIHNIKNLIISYKLTDSNNTYTRSNLLNDIEIVKDYKHQYINSNMMNKIFLTTYLDNLVKYNIKDKDLDLLSSNYNIPYMNYDNTYSGISKEKLYKYLDNKLTLSYTALENFYKCKFKYYISNILKINIIKDDFAILIGDICHYVLRCMDDQDFDYDTCFNNYVKTKREFSKRELFFLDNIKEELKFVTSTIKKQSTYSTFNKSMKEKPIYVNKDKNIKVTFMGVIDKVLYKEEDNITYLVVVDYKTGSTNINLKNMEYGLGLQLPIYLYLSNKMELKNIKVVGFYLQKLFTSTLDNSKDYETARENNLRLEGYSTDNENILSKFDTTYNDSKLIKGMKTTSKGFSTYSKVLNDEELDSMINNTDKLINEGIDKILEGDFTINPKVIDGTNVSCNFCEYRDICYLREKDITYINREEDKDGEEV